MEILERNACITGIGQSQIGRRLGRDPLDLTLDACLAAIEDAGLTRERIDGISTYPGAMGGAPGFTGAGVTDVQDALRLDLSWFNGGLEQPGQRRRSSTSTRTWREIRWSGLSESLPKISTSSTGRTTAGS